MPPKPAKKPVNLSVNPALLQEARRLGLNISHIAENGLKRAVKEARQAQWRQDNAPAIAAYNDWVEKNGLPLARHRTF